MSHEQRVALNIVPLSQATNLIDALDEWYFTGEYIDHGEPVEDCELCDNQGLRYHFKIKNINSQETMWVGSVCILRFQIKVYGDDGGVLDGQGARKKLHQLQRKMQHESCIKALDNLAHTEKNDILANALNFYKERGYLTPKYAFVVFWKLNQHDIDHNPSFFKINLRKEKYKTDLAYMPIDRVYMIWDALSPAQRKLATTKMGIAPPKRSTPAPQTIIAEAPPKQASLSWDDIF